MSNERSKDVFTMMRVSETGARIRSLNLGWRGDCEGLRIMTTMQLVITIIILAMLASAANAAGSRYSKELQRACASDYRQHCSDFGLETNALRLCMNRVGHRLSNACVNALVAAGEVTQSEINRRKRAER